MANEEIINKLQEVASQFKSSMYQAGIENLPQAYNTYQTILSFLYDAFPELNKPCYRCAGTKRVYVGTPRCRREIPCPICAIIFPTVDEFAKAMKEKLAMRQEKKGGWDDVTPEWLCLYLDTEVAELKEGLIKRDGENVLEECADVANVVMMIWDLLNKEQEESVNRNGPSKE